MNVGLFMDEFEDMVGDYMIHPSDVMITGDFNIHVDDPSDNSANRLKQILSSAGLTQHVTEPTHVRGHCLDLLITRGILIWYQIYSYIQAFQIIFPICVN